MLPKHTELPKTISGHRAPWLWECDGKHTLKIQSELPESSLLPSNFRWQKKCEAFSCQSAFSCRESPLVRPNLKRINLWKQWKLLIYTADLFNVELVQLPSCLRMYRSLIKMKTGGVTRSNIFGITKDNHLTAGCLASQSVSAGFLQIQHPCACDELVGSDSRLRFSCTDLLWQACTMSSCGGRRRNVSHLHQPKGSAPCVSIRAYLSSNETLCDGGAGGGCLIAGASSVDLPPRHEVPGMWQHTVTLPIGDRWIMLTNETLHMGHDSKIRPIFVLYEWCIVIFFSCNLKIFALIFIRFI